MPDPLFFVFGRYSFVEASAKQLMRSMLNEGVSVLVPAYNSGRTLWDLVTRVETALAKPDRSFELILVNDGSRDDTWDVICDIAAEKPWVRGIAMMRNYGQHNALLAGLRAARYSVVVTMDDDLQHPPEEMQKLLAALVSGVDVVYGPASVEPHGFWRGIASRLTKVSLQQALGVSVAKNVSAYRVFRTRLRDAFERYESPFVSLDVVLTWATSRYVAVPVRHDSRMYGSSNYTFRHLVRHALTLLTGFSVWPLQMASVIGFGFTALGLLVFLYVLVQYFLSSNGVPGFPFLASIIAIFSGAQMFALGIIGEYLARMHFRMMGRPTYVVGSVTASCLDDGTGDA
jgi:glycosyltransferase involved in cell wall biosynthesis